MFYNIKTLLPCADCSKNSNSGSSEWQTDEEQVSKVFNDYWKEYATIKWFGEGGPAHSVIRLYNFYGRFMRVFLVLISVGRINQRTNKRHTL